MKNKLYLIDGSGYIFRAYFATMQGAKRMTSADGTPTNAVYLFNQMLMSLIKNLTHNAHDSLAIAFDTKHKTFRHELYPDYKAHRPAPPEDLVPQFALIRELVAAWDIPVLIQEGFEADDLIATYTYEALRRGFEVIIVSADKDLLQLVQEGVTQWDPMRDARYDREGVKSKMGVYPEQVADLLALMGDASDNVPGIPKVGPKSATALLEQFGSLQAILSRADEIVKPALRDNVKTHAESARLSQALVALRCDVPCEFNERHLQYSGPNQAAITALFERLSFSERTLAMTLKLLPSAAQSEAPPPISALATDTTTVATATTTPPVSTVSRERYQTLLTEAALQAFCAQIAEAGIMAIDTETTGLNPMQARLVGISLAYAPGEAAYIPLTHHYLGVPAQLPLVVVQAALNALFANPGVRLIGQNAKYDWHVLRRAGFQTRPVDDDTMLLSYVLDATRESHGLDALTRHFLGHENIHFEDVVGTGKNKRTFDEIAIAEAARYAAEDADVTLQLYHHLKPLLSVRERLLYETVEMPICALLFEMEHTGITIDRAEFAQLQSDLTRELRMTEQAIGAMLGFEFNLNSPKQLAQVLFEKLGLPVQKRSKSGPSTDQSVLEALKPLHPLPGKLLEYRHLQKLLSTYIDALPQMVDPQTGRLHTSFNQALASTGRLSSSDPNLQNIPIKSEIGRKIRHAFVAPPGHCLIAADYSQVELRMLAHLSGDEALIKAFQADHDIHTYTAQKLFHVEEAAVTSDMRRHAKSINFGLLYGLSAFRLAREESISMREAKDFIDGYFGAYPKVRAYLDSLQASARSQGFVETLLGRKRYMRDIHATNGMIRQAAERVATNAPIQGSAADLIKVAMLRVQEQLTARGLPVKLLLQVHDELIFEVPNEAADEAAAVIQQAMEQAMKGTIELAVPLKVHVSKGANWDDSKK